MLKTLFGKMTAIFIAVLLLSFSITGGMLFYLLSNSLLQQKVVNMRDSASNLNDVLGSMLDTQNDTAQAVVMGKYFDNLIKYYSISTTSIIMIATDDGYLVAHSEIPAYMSNVLITENNEYKLPDKRQYELTSIKNNYASETGDFYGLFKKTGIEWLTVRTEFIYETEKDNRIQASIIFCTPVPEIQKTRKTIFQMFLLSVAIATLISSIFIYWTSRSITRPLKELSDMSKVISGGDFRKRLVIKSNDEVGALGENFNQMVDALGNLDNMRREFIANVSHELRTPMTTIRGFIQGVLDGTIPYELQNNYLKIVMDETDRLNRLVNNLLDLAKLEAGEINLKFEAFDINELIRISVIKLQGFIMEKELDFRADFELEKMYVYADRDSIQRVIINLIHNAIKFTEKGGKVTVCSYYKKNRVVVVVKDTGIGISDDEMKRIWERFHKVDKSRSKDKNGIGLGLAIVKNIINEHQQDIWVESEMGKGASFHFTLQKADES